MGFIGNIDIRRVDDTLWSMLSPFSYENEDYIITIETNFLTDGMSDPKALWGIIGSPMTGKTFPPSIIHDGLYSIAELPREECDILLKEMMLFLGVDEPEAEIIYAGVRLFGESHYGKDDYDISHLVSITYKRKTN